MALNERIPPPRASGTAGPEYWEEMKVVLIAMIAETPIFEGAIREPFTPSDQKIREGLFAYGGDHPIKYKLSQSSLWRKKSGLLKTISRCLESWFGPKIEKTTFRIKWGFSVSSISRKRGQFQEPSLGSTGIARSTKDCK